MTPGTEAYAVANHTVGGIFSQYHGPSATSWGPDRIDLVAAADAGTLLHRYYELGRGWFGWETISPSEAGRDPLAHVPRWHSCSWGPNRLDVFGVKNGHLEHVWYQGGANDPGWGNFDDLGGQALTGYLAVAAPARGRLEVMAIDESGAIQHLSFGPGGWSTWSTVEALGHVANRLMFTATSPEHGVVDLFTVMAGDHQGLLSRARYTPGAGWGLWEPLGRGPAPLDLNSGSLAAASDGSKMWLFGMAAEGGNLMFTREFEWMLPGQQRGWADWQYLTSADHGGSACRRGTALHVFASIDEHPANVYFEPGSIDERDIRTEILNR